MTLEINNISKTFGETRALHNVSVKAASGQALGLLGRNGAGKTTTIRIIMGIFNQDSGEVLLDGKPLSAAQAKKEVKIGYMPEERGLYPKKKISEQMVYFGSLKGMTAKAAKRRAEELLTQLKAEEYLDKRLDALSKGNQQKIQLAIAVLNDPDIVILDEPLSGLDPVSAVLLKELIEDLAAQNKIVLFSSHQMSYVEEFCRHICIIKAGEIVLDGDLREIKKSYPRDRVLLTPPVDASPEAFKAKLQSAAAEILAGDVNSIEETLAGFICRLKEAAGFKRLMPLLVQNGLEVERFEIVKPTLGEIFVEVA